MDILLDEMKQLDAATVADNENIKKDKNLLLSRVQEAALAKSCFPYKLGESCFLLELPIAG